MGSNPSPLHCRVDSYSLDNQRIHPPRFLAKGKETSQRNSPSERHWDFNDSCGIKGKRAVRTVWEVSSVVLLAWVTVEGEGQGSSETAVFLMAGWWHHQLRPGAQGGKLVCWQRKGCRIQWRWGGGVGGCHWILVWERQESGFLPDFWRWLVSWTYRSEF